MKALDTPVLLEVLRGRESIRNVLKALGSEELATTEINLYELEVVARAGPRQGRERRLAAIERLRRKLTVLPIDARGVRAAAQRGLGRIGDSSPLVSLMMGAAESAGCTELLTTRSARFPKDSGKVKVRIVA